jgi:predicted RNase H-like nuclease (RuvC/YqgF family)
MTRIDEIKARVDEISKRASDDEYYSMSVASVSELKKDRAFLLAELTASQAREAEKDRLRRVEIANSERAIKELGKQIAEKDARIAEMEAGRTEGARLIRSVLDKADKVLSGADVYVPDALDIAMAEALAWASQPADVKGGGDAGIV